MTILNFKKKWNGKSVEDSGCYISEEAKLFARNLRATIKEIANKNGFNLVEWNVGHYYISGFLEKDGKYIYFIRDIERYGKTINIENSGFMNGFLVRIAKYFKDYTGGHNHFCGLSGFGDLINKLHQ